MRLNKKELQLAEELKLYNIDIEGVLKRAYQDHYHAKIISKKIYDFCFKTITLTSETFTHYVPCVDSKRRFYRLELAVNGEVIAEYFGKNSNDMNENFLKLKKYCENNF